MYELDHTHFFSSLGLKWQAFLKKTVVEPELLTYANMLLMVEKGIRGGIWHALHRYVKPSNIYVKDYYLSTELSYLMCWHVKNLYGWVIS